MPGEKILKNFIVSILLVFFGFGCTSKLAKDTPIQNLDAPEWVKKGSGAFNKEKDKVFYGVGSVYGIRNYSVLRSSADTRAREEIAKIFQVYISSLFRDYAASTTAGNFQNTSEEQHFEQAIKTVTSVTLSGIEIIDHWEHAARGEMFSLARLNLETFKNNIEQMKELNTETKEYIKKNAEKLHEKLEEEAGKH